MVAGKPRPMPEVGDPVKLLVCETGHVVATSVGPREQWSLHACPECGSALLKACTACGRRIQAPYSGFPDASLAHILRLWKPPICCVYCGQDFKWTIDLLLEFYRWIDRTPGWYDFRCRVKGWVWAMVCDRPEAGWGGHEFGRWYQAQTPEVRTGIEQALFHPAAHQIWRHLSLAEYPPRLRVSWAGRELVLPSRKQLRLWAGSAAWGLWLLIVFSIMFSTSGC